MSTYRTAFTVCGSGEFPLDMLRYDGCHPERSDDAAAIYDSFYGNRVERGPDAPRREPPLIRLVHVGERRNWEPTIGRWASFGWSVATHDISTVKVPA